MCGGIAITWKSVPASLRDQHGLLATKIGTVERLIRFQYRDPKPKLPVLVTDALDLYEWGNRDNKDSKLPHTGWCRIESFEEGKWNWLKPEPVEISAIMGLEKDVWFGIEGTLKGIVVNDEQQQPHVYMFTQAAEPEYVSLTKHNRMPIITGTWKQQ